jgi:tRNA-specific 2-thiouridylase
MPSRVVLAMSGGVDSSVAAWLLKRQGFDVLGLFMRTGVHADAACDNGPPPSSSHKQGCCSARDAADARRVADRLDIPFHALDFENDFARIIDYFADEYLDGRTPNPCVVCNNWLKFGKLWSYARLLDAEFIATGHYARVVRATPDAPAQLHRAVDLDKDQSYVLFGLRQSVLDHVLFPLGDLHKADVRALAREAGLGVHDKPDSVEICFVPDGDHAGLIRRLRPGRDTSGVIVDVRGNVLASHAGIENFTIGQRKGLGFGAGRRRYVLEIVPGENRVVVGEREELEARGLTALRVNWLIEPPAVPRPCLAKIRYRHAGAEAEVLAESNGGARVWFREPQLAVTSGQAVVFYEADRVLGGGWIEGAIR